MYLKAKKRLTKKKSGGVGMEKLVKKYAKLYRIALKANGFCDIDLRIDSYEQGLLLRRGDK